MVGHFDICKEMARRNMDIRLSPLDNVSNMRLVNKKRDTEITIGISGDVINPIFRSKFVGGLMLCDKEQYFAVKKELESLKGEPMKLPQYPDDQLPSISGGKGPPDKPGLAELIATYKTNFLDWETMFTATVQVNLNYQYTEKE